MNTQPYGVYGLDEQEPSYNTAFGIPTCEDCGRLPCLCPTDVATAWADLQEVDSYIKTQYAACDLSAVAQERDGYPVNGLAQFFAVVAMWAALHADILCEEMDSPDNYEAWYAAIDAHRARIKPVVDRDEDEDCF